MIINTDSNYREVKILKDLMNLKSLIAIFLITVSTLLDANYELDKQNNFRDKQEK